MAKRKTKTDSKSVSKKTDSKKPISRQTADKSPSPQNPDMAFSMGSLFSRIGFGGAFLLISALVIGVLYWLDKTYFSSDNSQSWNVEYNLPQGVWAGEDVLGFVRKNNPDLFERSYDDKTLLEDVSNSFNLSLIVKKVKSAKRKYPNTVVLDVEYFEPVAMAYVSSDAKGKGCFPLDKDGNLLPSTFFKKSGLENYLAITGIKSLPKNPVGQSWSDTGVEIACQIAYELTPYKDELGIISIHVHESTEFDERYSYNPICFDIQLKNHTFIRWTRYLFKSTGVQQLDNELSTEDKIAILRQSLKEKGEIKPDSQNEMFRFIPNSEPKSE